MAEYNDPDVINTPNSSVVAPGGLPPPVGIRGRDQISQILEESITQIDRVSNLPMPDLQLPDATSTQMAIQQLMETIQSGMQQITAGSAQVKQGLNKQQDAVTAQAAATTQELLANQERTQRNANVAEYFTSMLGVGLNSERIANKVVQANQLKDAADAELAAIKAKQSIGIWDDPLGWIEAQVSLPNQIAAYNSLAARVNSVEGDINQSIAAAANATHLGVLTIPAITKEQAKAQVDRVAAQAALSSAQIDEQLGRNLSEEASKQTANVVALTNAKTNDYNISLERARLEYQAAVEKLRLASSQTEHKLRLAELADKLQDREALKAQLDAYDRIVGNRLGQTNITSFKLMPQSQRDDILAISAGAPGVTPADAFQTFKRTGIGLNLVPAKREYFRRLSLAEINIKEEQGFKQLSGKQEQEAYVAKRLNEQVARWATFPEEGGTENPFTAVSPDIITQAVPGFETTAMGDIFKTMIKSGVTPTGDQLLSTVEKVVPDTKLAALMVSEYYRLNVGIRDKYIDFAGLGVKTDGSYRIRSKVGIGPFASPMVIDLTSAVDIENALMRRKALQNYQVQETPLF